MLISFMYVSLAKALNGLVADKTHGINVQLTPQMFKISVVKPVCPLYSGPSTMLFGAQVAF